MLIYYLDLITQLNQQNNFIRIYVKLNFLRQRQINCLKIMILEVKKPLENHQSKLIIKRGLVAGKLFSII